MIEVLINETECDQRVDKFILKYLGNYPMSYVYKAFRTNKVKLNGKKPKGSEKLKTGDTLKIFLQAEVSSPTKLAKHFKVIYEDENVLIADKPIGMLTQKARREDVSLAEEVLSYLNEKGELEGLNGFRPAPSNRLDRNTSGLVLVGKNQVSSVAISQMLKDKNIVKSYLAVVKGNIKKTITIRAFHRKLANKNEVQILDYKAAGTKEIVTKLIPLEQRDGVTLIEVELITGKTHQIRAQLKELGHPIIGDYKYGNNVTNHYFKQAYNLTSQFLCAYKVKFDRCNNILSYLEDRVFIAYVPTVFSKILD
ncbi:RluA family pseudouridine synthase [Candidatus Epulonipiscium viviparus]|uniref:RluA family pseudouridine synthase n=1 Tax=Candidatus Epulonipiscium viviparus TaxID=420336 RepID=UPI0027380B48|nr:RluA family pseudouridine synthase [Candidatus Epulopiscium viviparus]